MVLLNWGELKIAINEKEGHEPGKFFSPALVLFPKNSEHLVIDIWYTRQHIDIYSDITKNGVPEIQ